MLPQLQAFQIETVFRCVLLRMERDGKIFYERSSCALSKCLKHKYLRNRPERRATVSQLALDLLFTRPSITCLKVTLHIVSD